MASQGYVDMASYYFVMKIKGRFFKGLLFALSLALIPVAAVSAQKITSTYFVGTQRILHAVH